MLSSNVSRVGWAALISCLAVSSACSKFSPADGDELGASDAADGETQAAPEEIDGSVLINGDFENGCAGWTGSMASLVAETQDVHSGKSACRVCAIAVGGYALSQNVRTSVLEVGSVLNAKAWVKLPNDQTNARVISLGVVTGSADNPSDQSVSTGPSLNRDQFQPINGELKVVDGGVMQLAIYLGTDSTGNVGECFLIDDVSLVVAK